MNYSKADMTAFFKDIIKKNILKKLITVYVFVGAAVFAVLMAGMVLIEGEFTLNPLPFIFLGVVAMAIFLSVKRLINKTPEDMHVNFQSQYNGGIITCTFMEDRVYIQGDTAEAADKDYLLYSALEKAVESDNYFYLFTSTLSAQIVKKSSLTEGSIDEVRQYLKSALGSNYEDITKLRKQ